MLTIKCANCKTKIFKYKKIGKGRLWHCWKDRIIEDDSVHIGSEIKGVGYNNLHISNFITINNKELEE